LNKSSAPVGIDFGTTNTLVYTYHPDDGPRLLVIDGGQPFGPIPTILTRSSSLAQLFAGLRAWAFRKRTPDARTFRKFKLDLPATGASAKSRDIHQSYKNARDFLKHVFNQYEARSGFTGISSLAFSVPESWLRGGDQIGIEAVHQLAKQLKLPAPIIVSEPVAAACFFASRYRKIHGNGFDGFVMVYDHGGGTLDYSLVRIAGNRVTSIDGQGIDKGHDTGKDGFGGEMFDVKVFSRVASRHTEMRAYTPEQRDEWLHSFEEQKRQSCIDFENKYDGVLKGNKSIALDELAAVTVGNSIFPVLVGDLIDVFKSSFESKIEQSLRAFMAHCARDQPTLTFNDASRFRVLLVGGFSTFYPVQRLVRRVLLDQYASPPEVFNSLFDRNECWSATAQGACLVAAKQVEVADNCPYTFGIVSYSRDGTEKYNKLIERGRARSDYATPKYLDKEFHLVNIARSDGGTIRFYIERSGKAEEMHGKQSFSRILPGYEQNIANKRWRFGCKCSDGLIFVYIKLAESRKYKYVRVGSFFDLIEGGLNEDDIIDGETD